jgi:hypothetical protein
VKAPALIYTAEKTFSHSHRHAPISGVGVDRVERSLAALPPLVDAAEKT